MGIAVTTGVAGAARAASETGAEGDAGALAPEAQAGEDGPATTASDTISRMIRRRRELMTGLRLVDA
jgi:hypothetical protein